MWGAWYGGLVGCTKRRNTMISLIASLPHHEARVVAKVGAHKVGHGSWSPIRVGRLVLWGGQRVSGRAGTVGCRTGEQAGMAWAASRTTAHQK